MSYGYWKPYVSVATRRADASKAVAQAKRSGQAMHPLVIAGRSIAKSFWGKAWCNNLEAYSDYANRLPRGRTYVRNGSVIDLKIDPGRVRAQVMGSRLYTIEIGIAAVPDAHWKALAKECTGSIASLVDLLQGKLSKAVMERICQPKTGLFPAPNDIQLKCSCPDWATMCKHVAAVLYGVGVRLDEQPELMFTLRLVDAGDLVTQAAEQPAKARKAPPRSKVLDDDQLADVFGIEMAAAAAPTITQKTATRLAKPKAPKAVKPKALLKTPAKKKKAIATAKNATPLRAKASKSQDPPQAAAARKAAELTPGKRTIGQTAPVTAGRTKKQKGPQ